MTRLSLLALFYSELVHRVIAQCNNATTTIRNHADASAISACRTFTGSIAIATDSPTEMQIMGVKTLDGDFIAANNAGLTTFASDVVDITGTVLFSNLPVLTNVTLREWLSTGTMIMEGIPNPTVVDVQPDAQQITELYVRNTSMAYFVGLTLAGAQMNVVEIVDNPYLQTINFGVGNVTEHVRIRGNSPSLEMALPHLTYAYNLEISDAIEVNLPVLGSISNGLDIRDSGFESLRTEELSFVGGDLNIANNANLNKLSMGKLVQVQGTLNIAQNRHLQTLGGLSALSSVGGALKLIGSFTSAMLPSLSSIGGDVKLRSSADLSCDDTSPLLRGDSCTEDGNDDQSGQLSPGAIAGLVIGLLVAVAIVVLIVLWSIRRRKRKSGRDATLGSSTFDTDNTKGHIGGSPTELGSLKEPMELIQRAEMARPHSRGYPGPEGRYELSQGEEIKHELAQEKERYELPHEQTRYELEGAKTDTGGLS